MATDSREDRPPAEGGERSEPETISRYKIRGALESLKGEVPSPVLRVVERGTGQSFFLFRGDARIPGAPDPTGSLIDPDSLLGRARAIADLDEDAFPQLHDFGTLERNKNQPGEPDRAFVCWRQEPGETLRARLERSNLDLPEAVQLVTRVAEAISVLHRAGWEHGFLRPASVFLTSLGGLRLLAAALEPADLYAHSSVAYDDYLGGAGWAAAAYLAPEQLPALPGDIPREADGSTRPEPDHRVDIWALGILLYESASGQLPFQGRTFEAMARSIRGSLPEPFSAVPGMVPEQLEAAIEKCLRHDPEARYQNIEELLVDLRELDALLLPSYAPVAATGRVARGGAMVSGTSDQQQTASPAADEPAEGLIGRLELRSRNLASEPPSRWQLLIPPLALLLFIALILFLLLRG
jgi:hypothetical protein